MCGIIGYVGGGRASEICYEALERLEYRGYDSAGIAVLSGGIQVYKRAGKVESVRGARLMEGNIGIGHTRWATRGAPSEKNAHPHISGGFAVVHNGIIENFAELKAELIADGYVFLSDTDSEAIAHLINKYYEGDAAAAVAKATSRLKGSYALCVLREGFDGLIAAKRRSPLVIGFGDGENFVASDVPALGGRARRFCVLADGDLAVVTREGASVYDSRGRAVKRRRRVSNLGGLDTALGGYPHYMLKEINEAPSSVINTAQAFGGLPLAKLKKLLAEADEVIITGCGTAFNSGLAAKEFFVHIARLDCRVEIASEFRYSRPRLTNKSVVIAVSQSGETADTVEAARLARRKGAKVIAVTNVPYSALTRAANLCVPICAGVEVCVAATKSYTAQVAALYMLACLCAGRERTAARELISCAKACESFLKSGFTDGCAAALCGSSAVFFLGRGADYAAAREASLKLKEVSYIFSDGYAAGELKHGTLALVDSSTTSVVIITQRRLVEKCENAVGQIAGRGGKIIVVTNIAEACKSLGEGAMVIKIPKVNQRLSVIPVAAACQLLAYRAAVLSGNNPDKPRNLAKSVTVE